ncbi:hypothetical protein ITP53_06805 [Nonomuraea sp. K274]|uniref:Uncharacterized protein n=1 Tax=Nonomuraea cypriaca TaxID=1187855 RepID=A0A931EXG0_9ACTN|nr:hypothetical protein [Nonomuraea cypriaca]MBF8185452.1 hypothetical protein [Nonomuraea cypriaca]
MALQTEGDWPGASDNDETEDPYADRPEIRRVAGEMHELLKMLTTSTGIPATQFATAPGGDAPQAEPLEGAGSLPDLQQFCAVSQNQMGEWPAAMQYATAAMSAYRMLVGEPGTFGGFYATLVDSAERSFDGLLEIARTSANAESATEEAAARQQA